MLFGILYTINPDYMSVLFTDPIGKILVGVALVMQLARLLLDPEDRQHRDLRVHAAIIALLTALPSSSPDDAAARGRGQQRDPDRSSTRSRSIGTGEDTSPAGAGSSGSTG